MWQWNQFFSSIRWYWKAKHIMQCWLRDEEINAPQKMWWRSFLRWRTVKETNAPQKMWWRSFLRWETVKETNAPQKMWWRSFLRWGTVKETNAPQKMWWRSFLRWGTVKETNAPQKMWWRSFLRWGTVKETNAPQKILMIRFETKTWLMENQVKLSCFSKCSSGNMTAVILMFTWEKSVKIWQKNALAKGGCLYN